MSFDGIAHRSAIKKSKIMEPRKTLTPYQNLPIETVQSRVETMSDMGDPSIGQV